MSDPSPQLEELLSNSSWLRRLATQLVGQGQAEDLTQSAYLAALQGNPPTGKGFQPWLKRVVRNLSIDFKRSQSRRRQREKIAAKDESQPGINQLAEQAEVIRLLATALQKIPPIQRDVILLRYFEEKSSADIARQIGLPPSTVRSHLARGIKNLRTLLDEQQGRDSWVQALTPLVFSPKVSSAASTGTASTAIIMSTTTKTVVSICSLLAILLVWRLRPQDDSVEVETSTEAAGALSQQSTVGDKPWASLDADLTDKNLSGAPLRENPTQAIPQLPPSDTSTCKLTLQLLDKETDAPIRGALLQVTTPSSGRNMFFADRKVPVGQAEASQWCLTDDSGRVTYSVSPGEAISVFIGNPSEGHPNQAHQSVERTYFTGEPSVFAAMPAGSQAAQTIYLLARAKNIYSVRFQDAQSKQDIDGVHVHRKPATKVETEVMPWEVDDPWEASGLPMATSDATGLASVPYTEGLGEIFEIFANGYGPAWIQVPGKYKTGSDPKVVLLSKSATLKGQLSKSPNSLDPKLSLVVTGYASELSPRIGLLGQSFDSARVSWSVSPNKDGLYVLGGLPTSGKVRWAIEREGKLLYFEEAAIRLDPGEVRQLDWLQNSGHSLSGQALTASGQALANTTIWITAAHGKTGPQYEPIRSFPSRTAETTTDAAGNFTFESLPAGTYRIAPEPPEIGGKSMGLLVVVPSPTPIVWQPPANHPISGTVYCNGIPAPGVTITTPENFTSKSDALGNFTLDCNPGNKVFPITSPTRMDGIVYVQVDFKSIPAGTKGVRIEMVEAGTIHVEIAGHGSAEGLTSASLLDHYGNVGHRSAAGNSSHIFTRLTPGEYRAWVISPNGEVGLTDPVSASTGKGGEPLRVILEAGARLHVLSANGGPLGEVFQWIQIRQGGKPLINVHAQSADGKVLLPAGTYDIALSGRGHVEPVSLGTYTLRADEDLEVRAK